MAGGYDDNGESKGLWKVNVVNGSWSELSRMKEDRFKHNCIWYDFWPIKGVIAAGGWYGYGEEFQRKSTEIYFIETG